MSTPSKQELLAEAEKTYRAYVAETLKLEAAGGADELPAPVAAYLAEPYKEVVRQSYEEAKKSGARLNQTELVTVKSVKPIDESAQPGAIVALSACVDGTKSVIVYADGSTSLGNIVSRVLYFRRGPSGNLVIFYSEATVVSQC